MYRAHESLSTPSDDTKLWRYLDLSHFLWLLSQQALYFANVKEFADDAWEGALPAALLESIKRQRRSWDMATAMGLEIPNDEGEHDEVDQLAFAMKSLQSHYVVNCWHQNEVESVAMWKLYTQGKDGVAIQTTVGRLKECLSHEARTVFIAEVKYLDHEALPEEGLISHDTVIPIAIKRRSFEHESEVRLILNRERGDYWSTTFKSGQVFPQLERFELSKGETVAVNVRHLIERIVASPDYPEWARATLQERVTAAGLDVTVEKSDLLKLPETPRIPQ
jgi:hypothetical protein